MRLVGVTGPSSFTTDVIRTVEEFLGANVVLLYMDRDKNLEYWVRRLDGVILAGGTDLHPMLYDRSYPAKRNMRAFDVRRDRRECKIVDLAIKLGKPILGICRGHQLLAVYRKNYPMVTDLCEESTIVHCPSYQEPKYSPDPIAPIHKVVILDGRPLFGVKDNKEAQLWVNSFHHQGILYSQDNKDDPEVIGLAHVSKEKHIIELMECEAERWISCQWHPECDWRDQESSRRLLQYWRDHYLMVSP